MGHFKIDRAITEHAVFAHPIALKIWIWCLSKASWKTRSIPLKIGKGEIIVDLKPGQFIFGRFKAEEALNIDGSSIYRWIQKFSSQGWELIYLEANNQYTLITICNWGKYQTINDEDEQPTNSGRTTEEQPTNTKKKVNTVKEVDTNVSTWRNDFNIYLSDCKAAYKKYYNDKEFIKQQSRLNPGINVLLSIEKGYTNYWGGVAGWKKKKSSKTVDIDWKATIVNSIGVNKVYYTKEELATA